MEKIRVLIVDDHALVRQGIAAILGHLEDVEVAGEAGGGEEAIEKARELAPDIILMDIAMPGLGGLEASIEILKARPESRIVALSQYGDKEYVDRFFKAGARGYILKNASGGELAAAVRAVARGDYYLHPSIASAVIDQYKRAETGDDPYQNLTGREKQLLKLLAEGASLKEAAQALGISVKTAGAHQAGLYQKLGVHSRTQLVKYAVKHGIIKLA